MVKKQFSARFSKTTSSFESAVRPPQATTSLHMLQPAADASVLGRGYDASEARIGDKRDRGFRLKVMA
jgi:hypothetical protein